MSISDFLLTPPAEITGREVPSFNCLIKSSGERFPLCPPASKLAKAAGGNVLAAHKILCWFVLVGWAIYPLGYMMGTTGWYNSFIPSGNIDIVYNIADAINKIGFGLVIYNLAVQSQKD